MDRLRARVADRHVTRLVGQFLKAGVLAEDQFLRTDDGTPQGGIISPLLSNIALSAIEERYERWVYHRTKIQARRTSDGAAAARSARNRDRKAGRCVFFPCATPTTSWCWCRARRRTPWRRNPPWPNTCAETTGLELSPEKTKVTALTDGFEFLGFHVTMRWDKRYGYGPRVEIPKQRPPTFVDGQATDKSNDHPGQSWRPAPRDQSHPARVGELLPLLRPGRPRVRQSRLVHRRPSLALAAEETPESAGARHTGLSPAQSSSPHTQGSGARVTSSNICSPGPPSAGSASPG
jgi:hypothetical protein